MKYPRILVIVMGRINSSDNFNNGLLLRNLFARWPRDSLAQIFSSGDNGDEGYFGNYYELQPKDRWLGWLFYRLKSEALKGNVNQAQVINGGTYSFNKNTTLHALGRRILMDTGIYELIFRPRLSKSMVSWVQHFRPDFIFSQGYNLTFSWLPLMLARRFQLPIIYYPTDDWPCDLYRLDAGLPGRIAKFVQYYIKSTSRQLVSSAEICIAFNEMMKQEYQERYGKEFAVLMHGDEWHRFDNAVPQRLAKPNEIWIVSTGAFDRHRIPLLSDLNEACKILNANGLHVRATIFPVNKIDNSNYEKLDWVQIAPCPGHTELVSFLRGADILFLPERFDETSKDIRLSISSKAHLFMFSARPIVVYSDPLTGIARYAHQGGWAAVVEYRDTLRLADTFNQIINNEVLRRSLIENAKKVAMQNHDLTEIQSKFYEFITSFKSISVN